MMGSLVKLRVVAPACLFAVLCFSGMAFSGSCIEGGCHQEKMSLKYLHGPVAAEEVMAGGCASCHASAGRGCTSSRGGSYKFSLEGSALCTMCHEAGTGTQHSQDEDECLECHNPHGSDTSDKFER